MSVRLVIHVLVGSNQAQPLRIAPSLMARVQALDSHPKEMTQQCGSMTRNSFGGSGKDIAAVASHFAPEFVNDFLGRRLSNIKDSLQTSFANGNSSVM